MMVTLGPLAYCHLTDPAINTRARQARLWQETDSLGTKIRSLWGRYPNHFGAGFLFAQGDPYPIQSPPGAGQFHWYMLPLMLAGFAIALAACWKSYAARVLVVAVLLYPAGDVVARAPASHALRSLPGLPGLILLGAFGAVAAATWLWQRHRLAAGGLGVVLALAVVTLNARYVHRFFGAYNRESIIYHQYHADLIEACDWLRPRLDHMDAVFFTTEMMNMPYIITLVELGYDPHAWFREPRRMTDFHGWMRCHQYGKIHFLYDTQDQAALTKLARNDKPERVALILRPSQAQNANRNPTHVIHRPDGLPALLIFDSVY
jgi:hypothetical protein